MRHTERSGPVPVLEIHDLTKQRDTVTALDGIDLTVEAGELVAVVGPNGSGKTTLFELVLGLSTPTGGNVAVLGSAPGDPGVLRRIGAMLQDAGLPPYVTVGELVRLVGRSYPKALEVGAVLDRVGLGDRPGRTVAKLSGGERQRLLLAMAIVGRPDLLLLDEPTAAMDPDAKRSFWYHARAAVSAGTTLVFATHDMAEVDRMAERVVILARGRIVADRPRHELRDHADANLEDAYFALTNPQHHEIDR